MTAPAQPSSPLPPDGAEDRPDRPATGDNRPEFTVSELATKLKQVVEQSFSFVRVRAEVGRVTFHGNGHVYLDLKDEKAVLNGVVWRPTVPRLKIRPEQGLEVVATGRLTTFPGRSQYQMVIEQIEPAGVGALMALLEKRKAAMAAEGLFDDARKKALPYLPEVIGVVTSPTGAVIRDILHRLNDRFPRRVLLWPVMVQGDQAAEQVAKAVAGFNTFEAGGAIPRPDLLIVARGGGSIEDLWPFNEEAVVRAVAASAIPVISAVGHETDTTLIDFVADRRAPTPTAAAEMAVPVRAELLADLLDKERRLVRGLTRGVDDRRQRLVAATRGLPRADDLVPAARQRLDYASSRLATALRTGAALWQARFDRVKGGLRSETMAARIGQGEDRLRRLERALAKAPGRTLDRLAERLTGLGKLLRSYSYQETLARGFALVRDREGRVVRDADSLAPGDAVRLDFHDGSRHAAVTDGDEASASAQPLKAQPVKTRRAKRTGEQAGKATGDGGSRQGSLF